MQSIALSYGWCVCLNAEDAGVELRMVILRDYTPTHYRLKNGRVRP
jgi:hypothetical protein